MPFAWTCIEHPEGHGSFPQVGLDLLSKCFGTLQPKDRFACPVCQACGQPGWMRPATEPEGARIVLTLKGN
jgi:hypothetical protein